MKLRTIFAALVAALTLTGLLAASPADAKRAQLYHVFVTVENLAPDSGSLLTPVWLGVHDGSFDLYDRGAPASPELERIAEDGNVQPLVDAFAASGAGQDGVAFGPGGPIAPGESATTDFFVFGDRGDNIYLSYASMVIPSNDAFVANGDPTAHRLVNKGGNFVGRDFFIRSDGVLDAGTEVNDELPANTAAFGQATPDTGVDEGGTVELHEGLLPAGSGGIVDDPAFASADFSQIGPPHRLAKVSFEVFRVPSRVTGRLSGDSEVPPVDSDGGGRATFVLQDDGTIRYRLRAQRIDGVLAGHIHQGEPGVNGPVLVSLIPAPPGGDSFNIEGTITDADVQGLDGVLELWVSMVQRRTYVNVHTTEHPPGELRADLR